MRPRTLFNQIVTVRPLATGIALDEFGDAPIVMPDNRGTSFTMQMKVVHRSGNRAESGRPGRNTDVSVDLMIRKIDIPPTAPDGWIPSTNDIFELAEGDRLFVVDVQPAWPQRRTLGRPNGGFAGWRVMVSDRQPTMTAATQYD